MRRGLVGRSRVILGRSLSIKEALDGGPKESATFTGWVRSVRRQKRVTFLQLFDGSGAHDLQVVADPALVGKDISIGSSVCVSGQLSESRGKGQSVELQVSTEVELLGPSPEDYPLQKKEHSEEFLRNLVHLRPRTQTFAAVLRLRNQASQSMCNHLQRQGFVHVHTPILVSGDCEGAGEQFEIEEALKEKTPAPPFFGEKAFLTVSGQLHAEAFASGMSRVYSFGPTFRAERHSKTAHHLAEFWMLEPEMAFTSLDQLVDLAQSTVQSGLCGVLDFQTDLKAAGATSEHLSRLESISSDSFARMTYSEAIVALQTATKAFQTPVAWGMDLQREHERYLCEEHTLGVPLFVTDYPANIKPFYAKKSQLDDRCVQATDLLVPGIGEMIGGSVREDNYESLVATMTERNMQLDHYQWYLDLRKYGSAHSAGFGLGFERFIQWTTQVSNIRDVSPCPRWTGHIKM